MIGFVGQTSQHWDDLQGEAQSYRKNRSLALMYNWCTPIPLYFQVFHEWGQFMRLYYNKDDSYRKADLTLNYLGYWTDGGMVLVVFFLFFVDRGDVPRTQALVFYFGQR